MNAGYNPPPVTLSPDVPYAERIAIEATQPQLDVQYMHGSGNSLDHYYAMFDSWISDNTRIRASSPDPEHYQTTPVPPVPAREVYSWSADKGLYSAFVTDLSIPAPTLPPYVKPAPSPPPFTTGAQAQQVAMLTLLAQIAMDVRAIKTKVGA